MSQESAVGSSPYRITLRNESPYAEDFFFFQEPAVFDPSSEVYSNCVYKATLQGGSSGGTVVVDISQQPFAGAQEQANSLGVGQPSGSTFVSQPIALTPDTPKLASMGINPLRLDLGTIIGIQGGEFQIETPTFNPNETNFNIGLSVQVMGGEPILSSFITAQPSSRTNVQPRPVFYVRTGSYLPGSVIKFATSRVMAAVCDATSGYMTFNVMYNPDGSWAVRSG